MTVYASPQGIDYAITSKFTSLKTGHTLAELKLNTLEFAKVLNGSGPWGGSLQTEDPNVRRSNWIAATYPYKTAMWVDINGVLVYGGIVTGRHHQASTGVATFSGSDFISYLQQRYAIKNYSAYVDPEGHVWAPVPWEKGVEYKPGAVVAVKGEYYECIKEMSVSEPHKPTKTKASEKYWKGIAPKPAGAPALSIAYYLLLQALGGWGSITINVAATGPAAEEKYWVTFAIPKGQLQTLSALLTQFQELGHMVGIDYAQDVEYNGETPSVTITLSYPRRGEEMPTESPVIDVTNASEFTYDEDGTQQANRVWENAGATGETRTYATWEPAVVEDGYPLLENLVSHTSLSSTPLTKSVLEAYSKGDLSASAYPLSSAVVTIPMFDSPSILAMDVGNKAWLRVPKTAGDLPPTNPRFPQGLNELFRIVRVDGKVPDEGVPVMDVALDNLPNLEPPEEPEPS